MKDHTLKEIGEVLRQNESFVLLSHVRPDGDAIGSQIGLGASLEAMGKKVTYMNEDGVPASLAFLDKTADFVTPPAEVGDYDVLIALDTGNHPRLGANALASVGEPKVFIDIDHHKSNVGYGTHNYIETSAPATGEIVYDLLVENDMPIPPASRDALYVAISTDTGSFQFPSTTQHTMEVASSLIERGLDVGKINEQTYHSHPFRKVELLRELLNTLEMTADGRVADWVLKRAVKNKLGYVADDSEGLIDHIRAIDTVEVAIFLEELKDGGVRVSMRSKNPAIDMCEVCAEFGGGGHSMAAGARVEAPIEDVRRDVLAAVARRMS